MRYVSEKSTSNHENGKQLQVPIIKIHVTESKENKSIHRPDLSGSTGPGGGGGGGPAQRPPCPPASYGSVICQTPSLRKQPKFRYATNGFTSKRRLRNERRNQYHTDTAVVTRNQYEISALVSQTSFRGEPIGGVVKGYQTPSLYCFFRILLG